MINKIQAATLWAYDYNLVDRKGNVFQTLEVTNTGILLSIDGISMGFCEYEEIGTEYFILARPLSDLTKEIEHEGRTFVPVEKNKSY